MPLYDFCCEQGHVTEMRAGVEVACRACPICGRDAQRVPFYESQFIIGETVARGVTKATREGNIKDKHGRTRVSLFQEAASELAYAHERAEETAGKKLPQPDLFRAGLREAQRRGARLAGEV